MLLVVAPLQDWDETDVLREESFGTTDSTGDGSGKAFGSIATVLGAASLESSRMDVSSSFRKDNESSNVIEKGAEAGNTGRATSLVGALLLVVHGPVARR